jgi:hypothetical protein
VRRLLKSGILDSDIVDLSGSRAMVRSIMVRCIAAALLSAVLLCTLWAPHSLTAQDWPRYGHDGSLTNRSPIAGVIKTPQASWSLPLAGRECVVDLLPAEGQHELTLSGAAALVALSPDRTAAGPPLRDIDGRGTLRPAVESSHERWAKILPDVPGLQRVAWNYTWTDQKVCRLQLFAYDQGWDQPRMVWQTDPPEDTIFNPLDVVCDIDGDGTQEICVAAHYRVMIFEGTTGRKESELRYHGSRPYGWFGVLDVDGDGQRELVTIGDFQSHVDVLEYDPQKPEAERLSVRWRRDIEQNIQERSKWPQVGPHPVANVVDDERPEIIINLFNDTGDGQWHVVVLSALSGETVADLPQRFCWGSSSVDDQPRESLFVTSTNGVLVHHQGQIELIGFEQHMPVIRWMHTRGAWCTADWQRLGESWSTTASQGMRHVVVSGAAHPTFYAKTWDDDQTRSVTLAALQCRDASGGAVVAWQAAGWPESLTLEPHDAPAAETPRSMAVRVKLAANGDASLVGHGVRPVVAESRALGIDVSLPIVAQLGADPRRSIVIEAPGESVCAIDPPAAPGEPLSVRWQRSGRGMRDGSRTLGLLATDLDADGACEVVAADVAPEGHAVLRACRGDGTTMWEQTFPQIPGALPAWNVGALTFWWPGHFRQAGATDLFVNTRRGLMHSDIGTLLEGANGSVVWQHDKASVAGQFRWGYAGAPIAVRDLHDAARDDLVCLHPVCFWMADGTSGEIGVARDLASRTLLPAWAAYGEPMAHDFNDDGRCELLLDSPYILALLDVSGMPLWHGPPRIDYPVARSEGNASETTACKHALLDVDADGRWEIGSAGYGDGVRVIDALDGQVLWRLSAPMPSCPRVAAANIDGQGGDELLYVAGTQLVAVTGDRHSGRILWTWNGPATLSMPAIADVDGDGAAEIVLQDATGTVHCLDQSTQRRGIP